MSPNPALVQSICSFLYQNDLLILPNFGAFKLAYAPATIDFVEKRIAPPCKKISFEPENNQPNTRLAEFLSQTQQLPLYICTQTVEQFAHQLTEALFNQQTVQLEGIGTLGFDQNGQIQFEPDPNTNFLAAAYAFPSLAIQPIIRETVKPIAHVGETAPPVRLLPSRKASPLPFFLAGLALIGVAAAGLWWIDSSKNQPLIAANSTQTDSTHTQTRIDSPVVQPNTEPIRVNTAPSSQSVSEPTANSTVSEPATNPAPTVSEPSIAEPNQQTDKADFIVVLGVFSESKNAKRMLRNLQKMNYAPDKKRFSDGRERIGIRFAGDEKALKSELKTIRKKLSPKAWVLTSQNGEWAMSSKSY